MDGKNLSNPVTHQSGTDYRNVFDTPVIIRHSFSPLPGRCAPINEKNVSGDHGTGFRNQIDNRPNKIFRFGGPPDRDSLHKNLVHFFIFQDRLGPRKLYRPVYLLDSADRADPER